MSDFDGHQIRNWIELAVPNETNNPKYMPNYNYETLSPDDFQKFAQALVVGAYPGTQCFPVGQKDGGRDIWASDDSVDASRTLFQVKMVRQPQRKDAANSVIRAIEKDLVNLGDELVEAADRYIVVTNVVGTAALESGSIDRMNKLLDDRLNIPAQCWWRTDLDARTDSDGQVKWSYPTLMSALDVLPLLLSQAMGDEASAITPVLRAFLGGQYEYDAEVRFKQIDLQNPLFDLFVDVPLHPLRSRSQARLKRLRFIQSIIRSRHQSQKSERGTSRRRVRPSFGDEHESIGIGAAESLLDDVFQANISRLIIEGAPGQGKSTLVQFACQVHRARLLNKFGDLSGLDENHSGSAVRVPIKIELRDYAEWLNRRNPFDPEVEIPADRWHQSLEAFIAAFISHHAGGSRCISEQIINLIATSPVLLVLDGLDEVADIPTRRRVVSELSRSIDRLEAASLDLQTVVTTRPSAFADSPGLSAKKWDTYELNSLSPELIREYGRKFVQARRLTTRDGNEVRRTLNERLNQPHIRELSRNPMQLAILMNLIQARGASLPDKRTHLYDSYVETIFNREADKSNVIRDHRDLLLDLHMFLAWVIHSESETGRGGGKISAVELRTQVERFLDQNGHDQSIMDDLFSGMVERIVALVSRVEGTFEFEVQSLREYFVARYLYDSAPYSPVGSEENGTKIERFEALATHPYWLNVTRFYAGCYSKGELASLVRSLQDIAASTGFRYSSIPRQVSLYLLSDWVFSQIPKLIPDVISIAADQIGIQWLLASQFGVHGRSLPNELPERSGGADLAVSLLWVIDEYQGTGVIPFASSIVRKNMNHEQIDCIWRQKVETADDDFQKRNWLQAGIYLGVLGRQSIEQLDALLIGTKIDSELIGILFDAGHSDYLISRLDSPSKVVAMATSMRSLTPVNRIDSVLDLLAAVTSPATYNTRLDYGHHIGFAVFGSSYRRQQNIIQKDRIKRYLKQARALGVQKPVKRLLELIETRPNPKNLDVWDKLVTILDELGCDPVTVRTIAAIAAGACDPREKCSDAGDLFDKNISLVRRFRYARLRAGNSSHWSKLFENAQSDSEIWESALLFISWAGPKSLVANLPELDQILRDMNSSSWSELAAAADNVVYSAGQRQRYVQFDGEVDLDKFSQKTLRAVVSRARYSKANRLIQKMSIPGSNDWSVIQLSRSFMLDMLDRFSSKAEWDNLLAADQWISEHSEPKSRRDDLFLFLNGSTNSIPDRVVKELVTHPSEYSPGLVGAAIEQIDSRSAEGTSSVSSIAASQGW